MGVGKAVKSAALNKDSPDVTTVNGLGRSGKDRDCLYVAKGSKGFQGLAVNMQWDAGAGALLTKADTKRTTAKYTSPVISCKFPAKEFLPSWNITLPRSDQSFKIYLRVFDETKVKHSPWFFLGEGGEYCADTPVKIHAKGWGASRIDYLDLQKPASAFQFKVEFSAREPPATGARPGLIRFYVHYSGTCSRFPADKSAVEKVRSCRVKVPYRSQLDVETEAIRHIVCSPTCLSMVLEHYGINKPTLTMCENVYDNRHGMYGVWPRAAQVASEHGCRAWVQRFRTLADVRECLQKGQPIIASIRVGQGELRGARYPQSRGHLIVITGYRGAGKIRVNDPYSVGPTGGEIEYNSADIDKVWLDRGGVAILIEREKVND